MMRKYKVLVSAYACDPYKGSEPGAAWNWIKRIARHHEVFVITRANNKTVIEKALSEEPIPNVIFYYLDLPRWIRFWKRGNRGIHLYYYLWQVTAYFTARKLHAQVHFDLAHHITFAAYWMPSSISLLPIPFIWGPLGGGGKTVPRALFTELGLRGRIEEMLRRAIHRWSRFDPFVNTMRRQARVIIASDEATLQALPSVYRRKVVKIPQVGISLDDTFFRACDKPSTTDSEDFQVLSVGRLIAGKGFELSLKAFSQFVQDYPKARLTIIGDGPERTRLMGLAQQLGVIQNVEFRGRLPRDKVAWHMQTADVFLFPSMYDVREMVVVEAFAASKPVVCLDIGDTVTPTCGIRVKVGHREQVVHDLAQALMFLAKNPALRLQMEKHAKERAIHIYNWDEMSQRLMRVYEDMMNNR